MLFGFTYKLNFDQFTEPTNKRRPCHVPHTRHTWEGGLLIKIKIKIIPLLIMILLLFLFFL